MSDTSLARWSDAERVLDEVLALPAADRAARAAVLCGDDADLRRLVERLLAFDTPRPGVPALEPPTAVLVEALADADAPVAGVVGPYRLVEEIGRGGMGRVVRAVREHDGLALPVAIKFLDLPGAAPGIRTRLGREREILSRLRHPHIARLLDSGDDETGTPYLVIELVEGAAIDRYVADRALDAHAIVRLFLQVCAAVSYAHGRLILHRDIKPTNVLVDGHGQAKLLDFGIAKVLEESGRESPPTLTGQRALTPAYAAPEQLTGQPVGIATDVYQLGLLLYELLARQRAHGEGTAATLQEAVVERDPPPPSTLDTAVDGRAIAGDLDAIVMKALRKDPGARYPTVESLARDLDDWLADRPVSARRGSTWYLLRKYARRHRLGVAVATGVACAAVAGTAGVAWQARQTATERDRALAAERRTAAINDFLVEELLSAAAPERSRGADLTVAEVLDAASRTVSGAFGEAPDVEAEIRQTLARTYAALGRSAEARAHAAAAERLLAGAPAGDAAAALRARALSASLDIDEGRYAEAAAALARVRDGQRARLGDAHPDTLQTRVFLVRALRGQGEDAAAEREARAALADIGRARPADWRLAAELELHLAGVVRRLGRPAEAEATARGLVDRLTARLGADHPSLLAPLGELGATLTAQLRHREALAVVERLLRVHQITYGETHPETGLLWLDLSVAYDRVFRDADALAAAARAHAVLRDTRGDDHPDTLRALRNIGVWHRLSDDIRTAEPIYRRVLDTRRRVLGDTHRATRESRDDLLALLNAADRHGEATAVAREIARVYDGLTAAPDATPVLLESHANFLVTVEPDALRDPARALTLATRAIEASRRQLFAPLRTAALAHEALGHADQAIALLHEALALSDALPSWTTEAHLVRLLRAAGRDEDAERFLLGRLERFRAARGPDERLAFRTMQHLARLCEDGGRLDEAERWWRDALAQVERTSPEPTFQVGLARADLGEFLRRRGRIAEAEPLLAQAVPLIEDRRRVSVANRTRVRDALASIHERLGRPDEAARWRRWRVE